MADTNAALKAAEALVEALKKNPNPSPAEHLDLVRLSNKVTSLIEQPYDIVTKFIEASALSGALYALLMTGAMAKVPDEGAITANELAVAVDVHVSAIQRVMRVALVNGVFAETAPDTYAHNLLSQSFQLGALGGVVVICQEQVKGILHLPEYFKSHQPDDLLDLKKSPYACAKGKEGKTYYDVLDEDATVRPIWNTTLAMMAANMPITGMFPFASLKEQVEREPERPLIVDIAGGRGQALLKIRDDLSGAFSGRMILQDLPSVIESLAAEDIPDIEKMAYDAFAPQPVKSKPNFYEPGTRKLTVLFSQDAHVYFMRRFLHDFYDDVCIHFLRNTAQAMCHDSRLIICDMLVPGTVDVYGPKEVYWLDMNLMVLTGKEKTLEEFRQILDAAGLELVDIYPSGIGATVQLEARLKRG